MCEEHLDQSSREDDSEEDDPKVEDLSIVGEGTETFGRKEIFVGNREYNKGCARDRQFASERENPPQRQTIRLRESNRET